MGLISNSVEEKQKRKEQKKISIYYHLLMHFVYRFV